MMLFNKLSISRNAIFMTNLSFCFKFCLLQLQKASKLFYNAIANLQIGFFGTFLPPSLINYFHNTKWILHQKLTVSLSKIFFELTFIDLAVGTPLVNSKTFLFIHSILTNVYLFFLLFNYFLGMVFSCSILIFQGWAFPHSITMSKSIFEVPFKDASIFPTVFTVPLRDSIYIVSNIFVSIMKHLLALTIFDTIHKCPLVKILRRASIYSLAMR